MRILTITNLFPNPVQPHIASFNRQQIRALAERHDVRVVAPILWTVERAARRGGKQPMPAGRRTVCDGIDVAHPRYWYTPKVLRNWYGHFYRESIRRAFDEAVAEFRPDLVFATWAYPDGWAAVRLARQAGLPVVVKVHGSDVLTLGAYPSRRSGTAAALREADAVVAVSQDLRRAAEGLGVDPRRIQVVYNGIDTTRFCPGSKEQARARLGLDARRPCVLCVSNLEPVKGVEFLLQGCAALVRSGRDFACHVIGDGSLRPGLERMVSGLGLDQHVRLLGTRPHSELPDWYRAADLFVLPSLSEGVPNVLLEATACGVPFVATRVGGVPEIAHLGEHELVPPADPQSLARAMMHRLSQGQSLKPQELSSGRMRSHASAAAELAEIFVRVVREHRGRREMSLPTGFAAAADAPPA
jgi:glycosyltransferase involved in cell wall biosynthesis